LDVSTCPVSPSLKKCLFATALLCACYGMDEWYDKTEALEIESKSLTLFFFCFPHFCQSYIKRNKSFMLNITSCKTLQKATRYVFLFLDVRKYEKYILCLLHTWCIVLSASVLLLWSLEYNLRRTRISIEIE